MTKTANYQLNQWDPEDRVTHTDFNADNAKLDATLKAQADAITAEVSARQTAIAAEAQARQTAVAAEAQARQTAVAAETQARQTAVAAEAQARQALATQITKCGNCKIVFGSYTGTGTYGKDNPNSLTFQEGAPAVVIIMPVSPPSSSACGMILMRNCSEAHSVPTITQSSNRIIWNGNTVSWYNIYYASHQMNSVQYCYVALIIADEE